MRSWIKILIGLVFGIFVGLVMGPHVEIFRVFGKAFIHLMTMLVGLIIFSSLVVGICHINDPKKLGRIGFRTIAYYVITTIIAIFIGIIFTYLYNGCCMDYNLHNLSRRSFTRLCVIS